MVTAFAYMAGDDGQIWESFRGHCVAKPRIDPPNTRKRPLRPSVLSRGKMARIFRRSLTFGKKMLSACYMSVRRPRWIHNTALPVASIGSFMETVPDFRKITRRVSDGPTFHAILEQVPDADLEYMLTDFLKERLLRRTLLVGSGRDAPPGNFWTFLLPQAPSFLGFWVIQTEH